MTDEKKETIVRKLDQTRTAFMALAQALTDEQWQSKAYDEGSDWRIIDILRHVADSERGMTALMTQIKEGGEGVPPDFDLDRWNQRAVAKLQEATPQELLSGMNGARASLLSFIDTLGPEDWDKKGRHASLRIMSIEEICHLIADHEQMHLGSIEQSLTV
jgi:hypothetical protein